MVDIPGDDTPAWTPEAVTRRTWRLTAILLRLGIVSFAAALVLIWPGGPIKQHEEVPEARDLPHQIEAVPAPPVAPGLRRRLF